MKKTHNTKHKEKEKMTNAWYRWNSPVGVGIWIIALGIFFVLLSFTGILS